MAHDEQPITDGWHIFADFADNIRDKVLDSLIVGDPSLDEDEYIEKFKSLKTKKEQFEYVWQNKICRSAINQLISQYLPTGERNNYVKSLEISNNHRLRGNELFRRNKLQLALEQYTLAIRWAPYPEVAHENPEAAECLPLAFNNRSATLFSMCRYANSLEDVELSIKHGYPKQKIFKLHIRKLKCLHALSLWTNDFEDIKKDLLNQMVAPDVDSLVKSEIEKMFAFLAQPIDESKRNVDQEGIDEKSYKIGHRSKKLLIAADTIEMAYSKEVGRYIMVNKPMLFGRPFIVEEPFASYLAPCYRLKYCYHCFKRLHHLGIGCMKCNQVLYCSENCRDLSWDRAHYLECVKLLSLQQYIGIAHIVLHIVSVPKLDAAIDKIRSKTVESLTDQMERLHLWPEKRYPGDYDSLFTLLDHHNEQDATDVFIYTLTAALLVEALKEDPVLSSEEAKIILGQIFMRHLMQLSTNSIAILDQQFDGLSEDGSGIKERPIGVGIYTTVSLMNHNCKPNVLTMFHHNKMVVRTNCSVKPGDQLFYCYGPSIRSMSKKDRQEKLKSQYYFDCKCSACENDEEDETRALLCDKCEGPVIYNRDYTCSCLKCKSTDLDVRARLCDIERTKQWFYEQITKDPAPNDLVISSKLVDCKERIEKMVFWKNPIITEVRQGLYKYFRQTEDYDNALSCIDEHMNYCKRIYGPKSYQVVKEQIDLINFKYFLLNKSKSKEIAKEILSLIDDTRTKLKEFISSSNIKDAEQLYHSEFEFFREKLAEVKRFL